MGIKEEELVRLLDEYMGQGKGYSIKPQVDESGTVSFLMSEDNEKQEKKTELFTGTPKVECVTCADIPNLTDSEDLEV